MPFDILGILLNEFKKTYEQLKEQKEKEPGSVDQGEFETFEKLYDSLVVADRFKETKSAEDRPLNRDDAKMAASFIDDFVDKFEKYSKESPIYKPKLAGDLCKGVEYTLIAVKAQSDYLKAASKLENGTLMPKMKDIISDYRWVEDVFTEDPDIAANKKEPAEKWDFTEHSTEENLEKYKESVNGLDQKFLGHVSRITGDNDEPMAAFSAKINLVQLALDSIAGNPVDSLKIRRIDSLYKDILHKCKTDDLDILNGSTLIRNDLFERGYGFEFDPTAISGDIENLNISRESKQALNNMVSRLRIKPYNLGMDSETIQALDDSCTIFWLVSEARTVLVFNNGNADPYIDDDVDNPIYEAVKCADDICRRAAAYIKGEEDTEPVTDDDIGELIDALGNSAIKSSPLTSDGNPNYNYTSGIKLIKEFAEKIPMFTDKYNVYKQSEEHRRVKLSKDLYNSLAKTAIDDDEYDVVLEKFSKLKKAGFLDDAFAAKTEFLDMCRNSQTREAMLKSGTAEQKVLASIIDHEFNTVFYLEQNGNNLRNNLKRSYNPVLLNAFRDGYSMTDSDLQELDSFRHSLKNSPAFKALVSAAETGQIDFSESGSCGKLLFENKNNVVASLPAEIIDALSQTSGNLYASNSDQYTAVGNAMRKYANEAHRAEGVSAQTCQALYEACTVYMYTHDSKPATPNGKLRFNAAASVMAKLLPEMLRKNPGMKDQVEKDIKINMIRSKHFRNEMLMNNSGFETMAVNIANVLKAGKNADMITGKAPTEKLRDGILAAYGELERKVLEKERAAEGRSVSGDIKSKDKDMIL